MTDKILLLYSATMVLKFKSCREYTCFFSALSATAIDALEGDFLNFLILRNGEGS